MHWYMDDIPMMGISGKTVSPLIWMTAIVSGRIHCSTLCLLPARIARKSFPDVQMFRKGEHSCVELCMNCFP